MRSPAAVLRVLVGLVALALTIAGGLAMRRGPPLPDYGPMPTFSLTDQAGSTLKSESLRGSVVVVDFIFTSCPDVCPALSAALANVGAKTADTELPVRLLSVSVDPERDTPEVLAGYARRWQADPARWSFVTGPPEDVRATVHGFAQLAERVPAGTGKPEDYNVAHGESFLLYDADGVLRGIYGSKGDELTRLVTDARRLADD